MVTLKAYRRSQLGAGRQLPVSPAHCSRGLPSCASPHYQHPMFASWSSMKRILRNIISSDVPLACRPTNTRYLKALGYALRQQEWTDLLDDKVPFEPPGRGRSRTRGGIQGP